MLQRLDTKGDQTMEQARQEFDNSLGVPVWWAPGAALEPSAPRDSGAPLWWQGDEDASQSFLQSQGVMLDV